MRRMRFGTGTSLVLVALGVLGNAFVVLVGLVTPYADPSRDRVDNALLLLGVMGLLLSWLGRRAGMLAESAAVRGALGAYALLSMTSLGLTDFGSFRQVGWGIKACAVVLLVFALKELTRPEVPRRRP